jgi:flagellar biosynthesis repressor protein FlbT
MGLKVELKPGERLILGECLVTNGEQRTRLLIEGQAAILREKEIMTPELANTPAKRIYLALQIMYTTRDPRPHHDTYFTLTRELVEAVPSAWPYIEDIGNHIITGAMYKALKSAKALISYEKDLLDHASRGESVRHDREADRKPA